MTDLRTAAGKPIGPIGQGTWYLGEHPQTFQEEESALRAGIEAGMNLLDTAEMYGDGAAETLVGSAIQGYQRDSLFLVSKVYPWNAGGRKLQKSCENTLRRMRTDYLDLYLLHWRGSIPLSETVEGLERLKSQGKIRAWGVSNLDTEDMEDLMDAGGQDCHTDQVLYHLGSRGIEMDLLPWLQERGIPVMAYCPLAQAGRLRRGLVSQPAVQAIASGHNITPSQVLLAFLLARPGVIPIPRTGKRAHTLENAAAAEIRLTESEWQALDQAFPAPKHKVPLDMQ